MKRLVLVMLALALLVTGSADSRLPTSAASR